MAANPAKFQVMFLGAKEPDFCKISSMTILVLVIANYTPVEGSDEAADHCDALTNVVNDTPKHDVIVEVVT